MTARAAICVAAIVACGGHGAPPSHPAPAGGAGSAAGPVDLGDAAACPPSARAALDACILAHDECNTSIADVEGGGLADIAVVAAHATGCEDFFVIAQHAGAWRPLAHVYYAQAHGRKDATFTLRRMADATVGGRRVTRIAYTTEEHVDSCPPDAPDDAPCHDERGGGDATLACTWPGDGVPACAHE